MLTCEDVINIWNYIIEGRLGRAHENIDSDSILIQDNNVLFARSDKSVVIIDNGDFDLVSLSCRHVLRSDRVGFERAYLGGCATAASRTLKLERIIIKIRPLNLCFHFNISIPIILLDLAAIKLASRYDFSCEDLKRAL